VDGLGFDSNFFFRFPWFGNRHCTRSQIRPRLLRRTRNGVMITGVPG
jgi:hypothetical protein